MHRQALVDFNAAQQGSSTIQDLLIRLDKLAAHMVEAPNSYMLWVCFIEALCDPLRWEVLRQGHSAEFSKMSELVFAAEQIEDTLHYDWGTQQVDTLSSNIAAQTKLVPERAQATYMPWPYVVQGQWPRAAVDHGPPQTPQVKLSVAPNSASCSETGWTKPGNSWLVGMTGQKQMEHVCFGCGKKSSWMNDSPARHEQGVKGFYWI